MMPDNMSSPEDALAPDEYTRMKLFRETIEPDELVSLYRELWRLAWPVFVGQGLNSMVGFLSRIIVSRLGEDAFNAVNIGMMVFFVIITMIAAVGVGTTALVAQSWGMGDRKRAGEILQQSLIFGFLLSVCISVFGLAVHRHLFELIGASPETAFEGERFLFWLFLAVPFLAPGFFLASALRGAGDTRTPMVFGVVMGGMSLLLAYGLILGRFGLPRLETLGAALSIDISFFLFSLMLAMLFASNKAILKIPARGWKPDLRTGVSIFRIGLPSAAEWILIQLGLLIYVKIITSYGQEALAGYFTGVSLLMLAQTPSFGMQTATTTLIGQSVGARDYRRAEAGFRRAAMLGFCFMAVIGIITIFAATPEVLSVMFGELGPDSIDYARSFILILCFVMPLMGMSFSIAGGLRGAGDTMWPLLGSSLGVYGGRILFAALLYHLFHPPVLIIWCSMFPDLILRITVMLLRVRTGKWKRGRMQENGAPG